MKFTGKLFAASLEIGRLTGWRTFGLGVIVLLGVACSHPPASPAEKPVVETTTPTPSPVAKEQSHAVQGQMHNVLFHFSEGVAAHIETLTGELVPLGTNSMPVFDDKSSFEVRVTHAKISVSPVALASVMNTYVFAKPDAPFKNLSITIEGDRLRVKGRLHSKGDIPFENVGSLSTTSDGRIRIHIEKVKALRVPVKGLMNLLGIDLANILNTSKVPGIDMDKDDVILDMSKLLPPPRIQGFVTAARIENNEFVTIFGTPDGAPAMEKGNYMSFRGGRIRFGKLTMDDADITVLDLDPGDPLDWNQDRFKDQIVAGYCKITPTFGLRAYIKDYNKLPLAPKK
jgi:hypothetical protein